MNTKDGDRKDWAGDWTAAPDAAGRSKELRTGVRRRLVFATSYGTIYGAGYGRRTTLATAPAHPPATSPPATSSGARRHSPTSSSRYRLPRS